MTSRDHDEGFTILELLIALSIIAAVMAVLSSSIGYVRYFVSRLTSQIEFTDQLSVARRVLQDALTQVAADSSGSPLFGTARKLTVRTKSVRPLPFVSVVILTVVNSKANLGVFATWRAIDRVNDNVTHQLLPPGYHLSFSYYTSKAGWADQWNDKRHLPQLIRAQITDRDVHETETPLVFSVTRISSMDCGSGQPYRTACGGRP